MATLRARQKALEDIPNAYRLARNPVDLAWCSELISVDSRIAKLMEPKAEAKGKQLAGGMQKLHAAKSAVDQLHERINKLVEETEKACSDTLVKAVAL